jgi:formylglycine-generating enzyme required for sulfatase activity
MVKTLVLSIAVFISITSFALADTFGTGSNAFAIDFVPISGETNPTIGYGIVNKDYRIGKYEITNNQWNKFKATYSTVAGTPMNAYGYDPSWIGENVPTNNVSWYEAAQFVNFLNTSKGYQTAYKFTGTQGTSDYTFTTWDVSDAGYNYGNPFRNSNAFYFLPTEDEWVKAAYWNGMTLQTYATKAGESLYQGKGSNGGWNYGYAANPSGPWAVGSGSQELNGTFDMMGNLWEWMESPYYSGDYLPESLRVERGASYGYSEIFLTSSYRTNNPPYSQHNHGGFRVASIPEPCSLLLLGLGGMLIRKR